MGINKPGEKNHTIRVDHLPGGAGPCQVFLPDPRDSVPPDGKRSAVNDAPVMIHRTDRGVPDDQVIFLRHFSSPINPGVSVRL
jgi:hypothetical protein